MYRKRKKISNLLILFILSILCYGFGRLYYRLTDDFTLKSITYDFAYNKDWDIPLPKKEEKDRYDQILSQTYTYLGKGAQAFAFASEDGKYVVKFFKFKHLRTSPFLSLLPDIQPFYRFKTMKKIRKNREFNTLFSGYKLAFDHLRDEAGILYAHLNRTKGIWNTLTIKDKMGFTKKVDLDQIPFIIQERAIKTRDVLRNHLQSKNIKEAKYCIRRIFDTYYEKYLRGLYDQDHGVLHNTGFVGNKIIHFDLGNFVKDDKIKEAKANLFDLTIIAWKFSQWIKKNYPMLHTEMIQDMEEKMGEMYQEKVTIPDKLVW